jgi:hypothetical protein
MRSRILAHGAQISKKTISTWNKETLSRTGSLKPYELERYASKIQLFGMNKVPGEYERWAGLATLIPNVRLMDMSGTKNQKKGGRGIEEIALELEKEKKQGHMPCCVVIDYAGLCVKRYVNENHLRDDQVYTLLNRFGYDCLRLIASPFRTSVWIMHQLSGEANKRTSATKQHYSDAAGGKSFAENLWFCFQLGIPQEDNRAMWFSNDIARRAVQGGSKVVYLDGDLATIRDGEKLFVEENNRFVKIEDQKETVHRVQDVRVNGRSRNGRENACDRRGSFDD